MGLGCKQERDVLFSLRFWKGHWLGGILSWQKPRLFPLSDLPGAAFQEAGGQVRCGGRLPAPVSRAEGLQPSRGRAVRCLSRFVTGWKWPLAGHDAAASSPKCHWCLAFMGLISQLLHPLRHKAKCLWCGCRPPACKLCWHFSLAHRACETSILEKTHECEAFKTHSVTPIFAEGCAGEPCVILCICRSEDLRQIFVWLFLPRHCNF